MSHFIYSTKAIILGEMPNGEDNRLYFLLTEDLGFVMAQAVGVRLLKSKLRFHLSLFAKVEIELVRGKNIWRIVNVYPRDVKTFFNNSHVALFARLAQLVRRMVQGEEQNKKLFNEVAGVREILANNNLSKEETDNLELVSVARILHTLGYFDAIGKYCSIMEGNLDKLAFSEITPFKRDLLDDINQSLKESHL